MRVSPTGPVKLRIRFAIRLWSPYLRVSRLSTTLSVYSVVRKTCTPSFVGPAGGRPPSGSPRGGFHAAATAHTLSAPETELTKLMARGSVRGCAIATRACAARRWPRQ